MNQPFDDGALLASAAVVRASTAATQSSRNGFSTDVIGCSAVGPRCSCGEIAPLRVSIAQVRENGGGCR